MLAAAVALAIGYWGPVPCPTAVHVQPLPPPVIGQAWRHTDGTCEIVIASGEYRWKILCSVVLHEHGHLVGQPHSPDAMSPMFPVLWRTADACRGRRPAQFPAGFRIRL